MKSKRTPVSRDTLRLDWLEAFVNEHGALLLHVDADTHRHCGLGLRTGRVVRTLRQAIDGCMGDGDATKGSRK